MMKSKLYWYLGPRDRNSLDQKTVTGTVAKAFSACAGGKRLPSTAAKALAC